MNEFIRKIANLLEVDEHALTPEFRLDLCAMWDSLSIISAICLIDQHFHKSICGNRISKCKTFGDLLHLAQEC